jgi:DNA-binding MarR family transcriptional regulator
VVENPDAIDVKLAAWESDLPGVDLEVEGIVDRIALLHKRIRTMLADTLAEFGLNVGEWAVLGSLLRAGAPYQRSPGALAKSFDLTSGAMTNRLDRLEAEELIRRLPDPDDRRGVIVELTPKGRDVWQRAVGAQAAKESFVASSLDASEQQQLNALLRRMVQTSEQAATLKE